MMRIAVFYSLGPHFERTLLRLSADFPDAEITAIVPPGFPWSMVDSSLVDKVLPTELVHYTPRTVTDNIRLIRTIRREKFDLFVVMFNSFQLQMLAALTGTSRKMVCLPQGRLLPLTGNVATVIIEECLRRIWGAGAYAAMWLAIRLLRVRPRNET